MTNHLQLILIENLLSFFEVDAKSIYLCADGTRMVLEWYTDGTRMVHGWYPDGMRMDFGCCGDERLVSECNKLYQRESRDPN